MNTRPVSAGLSRCLPLGKRKDIDTMGSQDTNPLKVTAPPPPQLPSVLGRRDLGPEKQGFLKDC